MQLNNFLDSHKSANCYYKHSSVTRRKFQGKAVNQNYIFFIDNFMEVTFEYGKFQKQKLLLKDFKEQQLPRVRFNNRAF